MIQEVQKGNANNAEATVHYYESNRTRASRIVLVQVESYSCNSLNWLNCERSANKNKLKEQLRDFVRMYPNSEACVAEGSSSR